MLTTDHTRIDVFRKKISLEVGSEKVVFKANEVVFPLPVASVFAIKNLHVPNNFGIQEDLEEFLMIDDFNGDLGDILELNDLFPGNDVDPFGALSQWRIR
nr:hypothetical protein [Tanacetum cinerariifolium]